MPPAEESDAGYGSAGVLVSSGEDQGMVRADVLEDEHGESPGSPPSDHESTCHICSRTNGCHPAPVHHNASGCPGTDRGHIPAPEIACCVGSPVAAQGATVAAPAKKGWSVRSLLGMGKSEEPEFDPGFPVDPEYYERTGARGRAA